MVCPKSIAEKKSAANILQCISCSVFVCYYREHGIGQYTEFYIHVGNVPDQQDLQYDICNICKITIEDWNSNVSDWGKEVILNEVLSGTSYLHQF